MRISKQFADRSKTSSRRLTVCLLILAVLTGTFRLGLSAQQKQKMRPAKLTEDQRILHVLNRLGFGARPGDIERIKSIGIETYINQQLSPEKIADPVAEAKIKDLTTLNMTTAELYEKFPQPNQLLQQLQRRGELPADLAAARENRVKANTNSTQANEPQKTAEASETTQSMPAQSTAPSNLPNNSGNPLDNEKYRELLREYYARNGLQLPQRIIGELQASRILRAVYSERQLQEVMVDFWTNHFNVFVGKGVDRWLLTAYDRDTIRPNALGKFSDLLLATAKSPAMLFYLDNFQSVSPNAPAGPGPGGLRPRAQQRDSLLGLLMNGRRNRQMDRYPNARQQPTNLQAPKPNAQRPRRGINENYARELMELHTLGVDGGYTQKDVQEVARCFTGWTIFAPRGAGAAAAAMMGQAAREDAGSFFFNARVHDDGEKVVLGHKIPAGGGIKDGLMVLDILSHHPSTAMFVATKLVRHFVSDTPPQALVSRVAATYQKTDGDLREMLRAIFFSPEFNSPEAYRAKIKRPFELAVSSVRTLGADTNGGPQFHQWIARMGQPLYGFQTPNGYSDTAEAWVNTGALLERLNFGLSLASNRIAGTRVDLKRLAGNSTSAAEAMEHFLNVIVDGDISPGTKEMLLKQMNEQALTLAPAPPRPVQMETSGEMDAPLRPRPQPARQANITDPMTKIVGLILGSPEFQRQ
ncbi:MAG TPA: DUF1800 domain-containing protein [Pyrinomonadaceae bacterium]|nr:DUF1800 domain-containing protein [Pyrinomonadaceae bacterium]